MKKGFRNLQEDFPKSEDGIVVFNKTVYFYNQIIQGLKDILVALFGVEDLVEDFLVKNDEVTGMIVDWNEIRTWWDFLHPNISVS